MHIENQLSLVFLVIKMTLKRFLEGFLLSLTKSLTKNPSRKRFDVILMGKKAPKSITDLED